MKNYTVFYDKNQNVSAIVKNGQTVIPPDPANTDYQAYLRWLEEGNEPLPADEPTPPED